MPIERNPANRDGNTHNPPQSAISQRALPTRRSALIFRIKTTGLQLRRAAQDSLSGLRHYPTGDTQDFPCIIAESRTPLWNAKNREEAILQQGKVQNLRCAVRRLNGALLPAENIFSFWKQIGQATRRRGYIEGRLLREGCLIPAVGGGLCQLSNALYDAALQAGCEIIERHAHSQVIPGSAAESGRDATVAWNYIDLRFRARQPIRIEARLSHDELVVRFHAAQPKRAVPHIIPLTSITTPRPRLDVERHSCVSCGQEQCFQHIRTRRIQHGQEHTAYLMNECWPEFQQYVKLAQKDQDAQSVLGIPIDGMRWRHPRYRWDSTGYHRVVTAPWPTLEHSLAARRGARDSATHLQAQLRTYESVAQHLARALAPDVTHVVVAQSLLPFLWRDGHLGGRTFDVLMTRLPIRVVHERLDVAFAHHPDRLTLNQFRAPHRLAENEAAALESAQSIVTPHHDVASLFPHKARLLNWCLPPSQPTKRTERICIAFPGPTAARKGAYELREVVQRLDLEVVLRGSELEGENFWQGVRTCRAEANWLENVSLVIQPALIEDNPRRLLSALASGVPIVVTAACGIPRQDGVYLAPAGDVDSLFKTVQDALGTLRADEVGHQAGRG